MVLSFSANIEYTENLMLATSQFFKSGEQPFMAAIVKATHMPFINYLFNYNNFINISR